MNDNSRNVKCPVGANSLHSSVLCFLSFICAGRFSKEISQETKINNSILASDIIQLYPLAEIKTAHLVYKRTHGTIDTAAPDLFPSLLIGKESQLGCISLGSLNVDLA